MSRNSFTTICCLSLLICTIICSSAYSAPKGKSTYQEIEKDGRIYVFTSPNRKNDFQKSDELGKSIIKIGYGSNNKTVVFDSDEAVKEYQKRNIR